MSRDARIENHQDAHLRFDSQPSLCTDSLNSRRESKGPMYKQNMKNWRVREGAPGNRRQKIGRKVPAVMLIEPRSGT